jgi:hypothetical protein
MSESRDPIPTRDRVSDRNGILSRAWHQFLDRIFKDIYDRIETLETTSADHETRITALEP